MTDTPLDMSDVWEEEPSVNGSAPDDEELAPKPYGTGAFDDDEDGPEEKRPVRAGPRTSLADMISIAWGGVGFALVRSGGPDVPAGRCMQLQAPMAGAHFDKMLAHTWLDKMLQPFAKTSESLEGMSALVGLPLLVSVYVRNEAMGPVIEPFIRQFVETTLVDMAPILRKQSADNKRAAKALSELDASGIFPDMQPGDDPVEAVLRALFAPPPGYEPEPADDAG